MIALLQNIPVRGAQPPYRAVCLDRSMPTLLDRPSDDTLHLLRVIVDQGVRGA